jgi:DNA-binding NtrC family response regulator
MARFVLKQWMRWSMRANRKSWERTLVLRSPTAPPSSDWEEVARLLPESDRASDSLEAAGLLREKVYDLILADSVLADGVLPGGSFFGLLGSLVARQRTATLVVQAELPEGPRWVKLVEQGEYDPDAEPMKSERFLCWLEDWLEKSSPSERVEAA